MKRSHLAIVGLTAMCAAGAVGDTLPQATKACTLRFDLQNRTFCLGAPSGRYSLLVHGKDWKGMGYARGLDGAEPLKPSVDCRHDIELAQGDLSLTGRVAYAAADGVGRIHYDLLARRAGDFETISFQGDCGRDGFEGGTLTADGQSFDLPGASGGTRKPKGRVKTVRLASADGARFVEFAFDPPVRLSLSAKAASATFALRASLRTHGTVRVGERVGLEVAVRSHVPVVPSQRVWTAEGDEFVPLDFKAEIVRGSVLDFTDIVPRAPCGTYGRLRPTPAGHFEFEKLPGVRQKFFGMNLHSYACYQTPEDAARLTDLLVRCGYNAVRFHNFENEYMGLTKGSPDEATPVEERFEGLDNLVKACCDRGLYVTVDLHVGRSVSYRALGIDKPGRKGRGKCAKGEMKYLYLTNERARENLKRFVRGFLGHVNPHTGRRYADEPTLALVSVVNESPCSWRGFGGEKPALCDEEYALMREMRAFIRDEVKSDVPLTTCNGGPQTFCLQPMRADLCDYADDHFYFDHPESDGSVANRRYVARGREFPVQHLLTRLWGKPFTVTEFNWPGPSRYRATAGLLFGAFSGVQDWDGLWHYLWSHSLSRALEPGRHAVGTFEAASDPVAMATDRAVACLFLRGDMAPLPRKLSLVMAGDALDVTKPHACLGTGNISWWRAGWYARLGTAIPSAPADSSCVLSYPGDLKKPLGEVLAALGAADEKPAGGAVAVDPPKNAFCVMTPRTAGGSVERGAFEAGPLAADVGDCVTTLWASSVDGRPLAESRRILLTHLTNVHNAGDRFLDCGARHTLKMAKRDEPARLLMFKARAEVSLALAKPEEVRVYAVGTDGSRRGEVPSCVRGGRLVFACDTARDPANATFLYELARCPLTTTKE